MNSDRLEKIAKSDFRMIAHLDARLSEDDSGMFSEVTASIGVEKQSGIVVAHSEGKLRFLIGENGTPVELTPETNVTAKKIGEWFIEQHEKQRMWQRECAEYERENDEKYENGEMTFEEYSDGYPDPENIWGETA